jgi:hypothetical protein
MAGYTDYVYLRLANSWAAEPHRVGAPWARLELNVAVDIAKPGQRISADSVQVSWLAVSHGRPRVTRQKSSDDSR